ncbi:hypothetical protein MKY29_18485 [Psychrobacillus sp. FSL K6-2365]|uniref:hypothetical protein n=1 Tax=Psychrobacillus sp. FSL K6-2365 TaxID=2921546 RepID=UPI0030F91D7A
MTTITDKWHEWKKIARKHNVPQEVFEARIHILNWSEEKAATDSVTDMRVSRIFNQKEREIMRKNRISLISASRRYKSGKFTKEEAITKPIRGRGHELLSVRA